MLQKYALSGTASILQKVLCVWGSCCDLTGSIFPGTQDIYLHKNSTMMHSIIIIIAIMTMINVNITMGL